MNEDVRPVLSYPISRNKLLQYCTSNSIIASDLEKSVSDELDSTGQLASYPEAADKDISYCNMSRIRSAAPPRSSSSATETSSDLDREFEGYDYDFVPAPDQKYECPVCLMVLRDPRQTNCGHRFCTACIQRWLGGTGSGKCPVCNDAVLEYHLFPDNFAKREIMCLTVKCPNKDFGCTVITELRKVEAHLNQCDYALTQCPHACTAVLFRKDVKRHCESECSKRPIPCTFCRQLIHKDMLEEHNKNCSEKEVTCPACKENLLRKELSEHTNEQCLKTIIRCPCNDMGCSVQCPREEMSLHVTRSMLSHLQMLVDEYRKLKETRYLDRAAYPGKSDLGQAADASRYCHEPLLREGPRDPSFPTDTTGYGSAPQLDYPPSHLADPLSVSWQELQRLKRRLPTGGVAISEPLQKQSEYFTPSSERNGKPATYSAGLVAEQGFHNLLERSRIQETKLVTQDQEIRHLQMKITNLEKKIKDRDAQIQDLQGERVNIENRCCNGVYIWKVEHFTRRTNEAIRGEATAIHSPGFYTSFHGYKLCIRLNLNGVDTAIGTHLSLFIHFMKSENDDFLEWSFPGQITLTILDQNESVARRRHLTETLVAKPGLAAFKKPVSNRNHKGFGYIEFAPLQVIQDSNSAYIKNDTLYVKAIVTEH